MATLRAGERKAEVVDGIVGELAQRFPAPELPAAERFVRLFYRDVAPADLEGRDPRDLYGAALALFRFAQERAPGAVRLRAYNPRLEQHGGLTKPDTCAREGGRIKYQIPVKKSAGGRAATRTGHPDGAGPRSRRPRLASRSIPGATYGG